VEELEAEDDQLTSYDTLCGDFGERILRGGFRAAPSGVFEKVSGSYHVSEEGNYLGIAAIIAARG
jgi:hypothetical protein